MWRRGLLTSLLLLPACDRSASVDRVREESHEYKIEQSFIPMPDGVRLAVTWWIPIRRTADERFPALLELLPYRKDDDFYARDFPLYDWFARRGFLMAKVDVRGTGGSEGALPAREYSAEELADAEALIAALAAHPESNGRVGMWGISWGGFNAIQVALRRPPALHAILALHASDDLFHDDVRYIDGVLHVDRYALQIDHGNGLPRTPGYVLDSAYFADRFDREPWLLTYLREQQDGPFWRANALRWRRNDLQVPAYLIGGLLDGYRDTPIRALAAVDSLGEIPHAPIKVEIGPWVHAWPDNGEPGPNYEWRERAARWWDHWLRGRDMGLLDEPPLLLFQRESHAPDAALQTTPGRWRAEAWPIAGARSDTLRLAAEHLLSERTPAAGTLPLRARAGSGTAAGEWWGEPTGDMAGDDREGLWFDAPVERDGRAIAGFPEVRLVVRAGAALGHWVARLEDVAPDGRVALVTGGAMNIAFRAATDRPAAARIAGVDTLTLALHFTTWTFAPGHRVRLAVTTAQFPMLWPTPQDATHELIVGPSVVVLPSVPAVSHAPAPRLPAPTPRAARADVTWLSDSSAGPLVDRDPRSGETRVRWYSAGSWQRAGTRYDEVEEERYTVRDADPSRARFDGRKSHTITRGSRTLRLETTIEVAGDPTHLDVLVRRVIAEDGVVRRTREWRERVPRRWH